jgi:IS4 transposase
MKFTAAQKQSETSEKNENEAADMVKDVDVKEGEAKEIYYDETKKTTFTVIRDEKVHPANSDSFKAYPKPLRIVAVKDDKSGDEVEFLTNIMEETAAIIAAVYKKRWEIENFFKTIKQHFHIKGFMGTSYNAVCCQIWSALTAIILIKHLIRVSSIKWNFSNLINLFRSAGFNCQRLVEWINISHCEPGANDQIPERRRKNLQQTGSLPFR